MPTTEKPYAILIEEVGGTRRKIELTAAYLYPENMVKDLMVGEIVQFDHLKGGGSVSFQYPRGTLKSVEIRELTTEVTL